MISTFDSYVKKNSWYHSINPTVKLIFTIFLIILVFLPCGYFGNMIVFILVASLWFVARMPWKLLKSILIAGTVMFVLLFLVNWAGYKSPGFVADIEHKKVFLGGIPALNSHVFTLRINGESFYFCKTDLWGGYVSPTLYFFAPPANSGYKSIFDTISLHDGTTQNVYLWYTSSWYVLSPAVIIRTVEITIKVVLMITIITLFVSSTNNIQLTNAIDNLFYPLQYLKIPVHEWAMTIAIAIRFVPSLLQESQNILKAQASRGVDFKNGSIFQKTKAMTALIVPMFSIAFYKADDLSNAMEARSYNPRSVRTSYRNFHLKLIDIAFLSIVCIFFGFLLTFVSVGMVFTPFGFIEIINLIG